MATEPLAEIGSNPDATPVHHHERIRRRHRHGFRHHLKKWLIVVAKCLGFVAFIAALLFIWYTMVRA